MTREVYTTIHNKLIQEYLEENPEADAAEVYDKTADLAGDAYGEYLVRDLAKDKT